MSKPDESRSSDIDSMIESSFSDSRGGEREIRAIQQRSSPLPSSDEEIKTEEVLS
eukprot:CAMPEP_0171021350 /NCGR_PEP_ID=MMETSP0736-20130129/30582_1 /TAXON_ID=186038 /ORGANISM="Fragilariopsis kerguelensis, Strain L26-C5" /LENGTH=54 /DNA_ID=CAMNT_0011459573 /DNA_START=44 /DNA_END=205 /DNA_ORIENTATION=+